MMVDIILIILFSIVKNLQTFWTFSSEKIKSVCRVSVFKKSNQRNADARWSHLCVCDRKNTFYEFTALKLPHFKELMKANVI